MNKDEFESLLLKSKTFLSEINNVELEGLDVQVSNLETLINDFQNGGKQLLTDQELLQIGVVGQMKAGKSSFLNALFFEGEEILPKAFTPMTAGLTIIEFNKTNVFEIEYFDNDEWELFKKYDRDYLRIEKEIKEKHKDIDKKKLRTEIKSKASKSVISAHEIVSKCTPKAKDMIGKGVESKTFYTISDLKNVLKMYVGAEGEYTSVVKSLHIKMNDSRLKGLRIVDTPGVNDPVVSREFRTRTFLRSCHGVFLLSAADAFLDSQDIAFLNTRIGKQGIAKVILIASKFDTVLQSIGAGAQMRKEVIDFESAIQDQLKKNRERLEQMKPTIQSVKIREGIKLNYSASIGYPISIKKESDWDEFEKTAVEQMQRYFPQIFSTEETMKSTFVRLANIKEIVEEHLQKDFVNQKEEIIQDKVREYFYEKNNEIGSEVEAILNYYSDYKNQIEGASLSELELIQKSQNSLFGMLKKDFELIFLKFGLNLQADIEALKNNIEFQEIREIPTEITSGPITYKRTFGHKTKDWFYKQVDVISLKENSKYSIETYISTWRKKWKEFMQNLRNELRTSLTDRIFKFQEDIQNASFQGAFYIHVVDKCLEILKQNEELALSKKKYLRDSDDACVQYYPEGTDELSKDSIDVFVEKQLNAHISVLISQYRNIADSITEDMQSEIATKRDSTLKILQEMQNDFSSQLNQNASEYIEKLKKEIKNKEELLGNINSVINNLGELQILFKQ